eukprot:Protomagalhaensia_wolfi_Nauph_80__5770@NODE_707_length_2087_cov_36_180176_g529_i0_p1_GENE_NODE_707_length_2087_cov_36_180176_g529_i0NODE_707_length_2087_cov_36_180176_g529_i0_p1_ORF_typecomplete_len241_score8_88EXOSC1/PF10447_9/7_1e03EXOSC1/PF10447_9/1_3e15ECR1_N/PF14382_6/0_024_NODE_707_length_2087_cov_36_180176_g529_i049723
MEEDVDWGCGDVEIEEYFEDFEVPTVNPATVEEAADEFVLPGTELGHRLVAGSGCYRQGSSIIASVAGFKQVEPSTGTVSVIPRKGAAQHRQGPSLGSVVLARVVRVTPRYITCDIFAVDGVLQRNCCRGQIRPTDVIPVMLDRIALLDCFRPRDIIKAQVIATGVSRTFLLSTIAPEFGVIHARDEETGENLEPFASGLMRGVKSKKLVWRKCASPPSYIPDR